MQNNPLFTVKRSPKVHKNGFQKAFEVLPYNAAKSVRLELMARLNWSISGFYGKKRGDTPIRENEVTVIEDIFSSFGIDSGTGKKL